MSWYTFLKLAGKPKDSFDVMVESATSWGDLVIRINGKQYRYNLPYDAQSVASKIMYWRNSNKPYAAKQLGLLLSKLKRYGETAQ
jgi:hypothetical protein